MMINGHRLVVDPILGHPNLSTLRGSMGRNGGSVPGLVERLAKRVFRDGLQMLGLQSLRGARCKLC